MTPRFTVSIVTYVALQQVKACLASLVRSTQPFNLILTANGNPAVAAFFAEFALTYPQFLTQVIVNATNEGYIEPQKKAFARCETEFWVQLNDDTILPPDWLEQLAAPFAIYPRAALSAPKGGCQTILPTFHGVKGKAFEYLNGACLCCKSEIVREHGLFDPNITWAYSDDADLSLRLRELGYTLHYADFTLRHEIGATSKHVKEVRPHLEKNHVYMRRRWAHYLAHRKMDYPILIRRTGAYGDVLLTTPIIRALRKTKPLSPIHVETGCPEIFKGNPHVAKVDRKIHRTPDMLIINLDGAYEGVNQRHYVTSYAEKAGVTLEDYRTDLYLSDGDKAKAERLLPEGEWIAIHSGPCAWKSREWPADRFAALATTLRAEGHKVVLVGLGNKDVPFDVDTRTRLTIHETAAVIQRCKLFIGIDSLCFHLAQAVGTPVFGIFGITDPQYVSTRPEMSAFACGTAPSFGLRHRVAHQTVVDDGGAAMASVSTEMVLEGATTMLKSAPATQITLA